MSSKRYLSSTPVFVVSTTVFLGSLSILAPNLPLKLLAAVVSPIWFLWCVTGPILIINMCRYLKQGRVAKQEPKHDRDMNFPAKSFICFVASILILIIFSVATESVAREEVRASLNEMSPDARVYINEQQIKTSEQIIGELKTIARFKYHGSHPTNRIHLEIANQNRTLRLVLRRDSRYPHKYWVFYPYFRYTSKTNIGGITTSLLDEY